MIVRFFGVPTTAYFFNDLVIIDERYFMPKDSILSYLLVLTCCLTGCKDKDIDINALRRDSSIKYCKSLLDNPKISVRTKDLASLALKNWEKKVSNPNPILIRALLGTTRDESKTYLCLGISDGIGNVIGIGIRERHIQSNGEVAIIEETYPAFEFGELRKTSDRLVPVVIRKNNERKSDIEWDDYLKSKPLSKNLSTKRPIPELRVSIPKPGNIEVEIWIYDRAGHKSETIPLECLFPIDPNA